MKRLLCVMLLTSSPALAESPRVIALGGAVTEIVYALGAGDSLVGVDDSSTYPAAAASVTKVGYYRAVGAEGVLSLQPTLVLAAAEAGPPPVLGQLRKAGVKVELLPQAHDAASAVKRLRAIASALSKEAEGETLVSALEAKLAAIDKTQGRRVLVLFGHGRGSLMAAGGATAGQAMLELVGATNVASSHEGYKALTAEAVLLGQPEVVVTTRGALQSAGGEPALWSVPGLAQTPAGRNRRLVVLDDLFLFGFGPRLGDAATELASALR